MHRRNLTLDSHNLREVNIEDLIEVPQLGNSTVRVEKHAETQNKNLILERFDFEFGKGSEKKIEPYWNGQ